VKPIRNEEDVDELLRGTKALAVMTAWNELGLFDALADGPKLMSELPADRRSLEITAPVLKHLGLLVGDGARLALSPNAVELRAKGQLPSPRNFEFMAGLARMTDVLRDGGPLKDEAGEEQVTDGGVRQHDAESSARFLDMLYQRSGTSAATCHAWLSPLLPERGRVLDVGGGHGRYLRHYVDQGHAGVLFDFPHVVDYARGRHGDAFGYLAGNFRDLDVDFDGPYDLIFLSNIVHGEPDAENRSLIARLSEQLAPGGHLVLKDMFLDAHQSAPENAVFFGLTMLYFTRAGQSPGLRSAERWLTEAGLSAPHFTTFERFQLLRAHKPG
jgi:SAM-dependent methyltransferase